MTIFRAILLALAAGTFLLVSACQSGTVTQRSDATDVATDQRTAPAYVAGNGDRLRVTVFGHPDLSGEFDVDGSGAISLPLIGQLDALGLTTPELEARIVETLDGDYILNPRVSAEVINYRPFYILGEVGSPRRISLYVRPDRSECRGSGGWIYLSGQQEGCVHQKRRWRRRTKLHTRHQYRGETRRHDPDR